jgi:putative tryptophan/tyrosine transport system substrate-binding protein
LGFCSAHNIYPGLIVIPKALESAADRLSVKLLFVDVQRPDDFEEAFARIASAYPNGQFVAAGGLVSLGTNFPEAIRQAGDYLGRVLNGEKPENLPVMQVTKIDLVINMKTAKALGLTIPPTLLARADEVIE